MTYTDEELRSLARRGYIFSTRVITDAELDECYEQWLAFERQQTAQPDDFVIGPLETAEEDSRG